jgi:MFS transporter, DHA3 family, macrolide efflux protein
MYQRLFTNRNFMALWLGQMISFIGDYFVILAVPLTINRLTGSATMVGLSFIFSALPALLFGSVAGVFVDRWDRRWVMIASDLIRAVLVLFLVMVRSREQIWIFYIITFLMACTSQFFFPARNALLPLLIGDKESLLAANGMMQMIQTVGFLAGPAFAGFAIGLWGERVAFVTNAVGFIASALAVLTIRMPALKSQEEIHGGLSRPVLPMQEEPILAEQPAPQAGSVQAAFAELREGLRFIFHDETTLGLVLCNTLTMLGFGAFMVIWVPFLTRRFHVGAEGIGFVDSSFGLGMLLGGLALSYLNRKLGKRLLIAGGMVVLGVLTLPTGYMPSFALIIALNVVFGLFFMPVQSAVVTLLQMAVPDAKLGRVSGSMNAMTTVGNLASMGFASFVGEKIGLENVFVASGIILILTGLIGFKMLKEPKIETKGSPAPDRIDQPIEPGAVEPMS